MRFIGLISGTSVDGIDAALVEISDTDGRLQVNLLAGETYPYPAALREQILAVCAGTPLSMAEFAALDDAIAHQFARAALRIQSGHPPAVAIGSHGQTVFHRPPDGVEKPGNREAQESGSGETGKTPPSNPEPARSLPPSHPLPLGYSLQLGRGAAIAHLTGITTISNFRAADIAAGGQGAPLVSALDVALLSHPTLNRCVQNIGGIGNLTYLPARCQTSPHPPSIRGWDTGPGNVLLDLAVQRLSGGTKTYDRDGAWAASGTPCQELVNHWLEQPFFQIPPPKSTGRELFGPAYLEQCLADADQHSLTPADTLATLTELTAASIALNYRRFLPQMPDQVLLCGGGSKNLYLKRRLQTHLETSSVLTTDDVGLNADFKEAITFAVLAYWRQKGIPGNLPEVTGAKQAVLLGEIYQVI
ncbi:anhydro-N-acetylmuramic acid kinase [Leptothermofonsia sichuanensis E412]|uniref:anhydro-N-acetylmuramic acid kinase n=1 Tax=Leptothermofonsia sichuanensis TaxID=2917832 RepID=UPI001CA62C11|nr:anhydro-N-acetylmuramic acid kinase [Leptothermofonsia sichuanensis]QZZ23725.1 anhydro-N-acetylmuramic acid kinase [Leptothermofonsia sichuanensis E412]